MKKLTNTQISPEDMWLSWQVKAKSVTHWDLHGSSLFRYALWWHIRFGFEEFWGYINTLSSVTFLWQFLSRFCDVKAGIVLTGGKPLSWGCAGAWSSKVFGAHGLCLLETTLMLGSKVSQQSFALLQSDQCYSLQLSLVVMLWLMSVSW